MKTEKYDKVVEAAEALARSGNQGTWGLADAVREAIARDSYEKFTELAEQLTADEIVRADGRDYDAYGLQRMWDTAKTWPADRRHVEASYRTHQEAGAPDDGGGLVLAALCAVARGETVTNPGGLEPLNWSLACDKVRASKRAWPVSANAVRIAMGRLPNVPGRDRPGIIHGQVLTEEDRRDWEQERMDAVIRESAASALSLLLLADRYVGQAVSMLKQPGSVTDEVRAACDKIEAALDTVKVSS